MISDRNESELRWTRIRPDAVLAIRELAKMLEADGPPQDMLDLYLYSKKVVAEVMEARLDMELVERCDTFYELREKLGLLVSEKYGALLPKQYLSIPYGSKVHEKLFQILLQRFDTDVPSSLLRVLTRDSVHTERRLRELRELGLDIRPGVLSGVGSYRLCSLGVDTTLIPTMIYNVAQRKEHRYLAEDELLRILGFPGDDADNAPV